MKKLFTCILAILFVVSIGRSEISFGQEKETNYGYGKVASVLGESITISEVVYNEDTGEETYVEGTYTITQDTELENISSIDALEVGKEVDIEYVEKDGKKIVSSVYVYIYEE